MLFESNVSSSNYETTELALRNKICTYEQGEGGRGRGRGAAEERHKHDVSLFRIAAKREALIQYRVHVQCIM